MPELILGVLTGLTEVKESNLDSVKQLLKLYEVRDLEGIKWVIVLVIVITKV